MNGPGASDAAEGRGEDVAGGEVDPGPAAEALLAWYRGRRRDVPWRDETDPYRIWVAEVMAQQTRITTVRDYWGDFLERFPDVETLARADRHDVLKAWEGLGYYARARRLHAAAREVVERYGGELPEDPERLRELPGIGPYTAGAVASLAFGRPEPAVDGNTRRVLCRLLDLPDPGDAELRDAARRLLEARPEEPAALNQALMDLGGEVCTPAAPSCDLCPLAAGCLARARGTVDRRPPDRERRELPHHRVALGLVWEEDRLLVQRRPADGMLGGLWEFPGGKVEGAETPREAVRRELREELAIEVEVGAALEPVEHAYSHFRVTLLPFHARRVSGRPRARSATEWRWAGPGELEELAFPTPNRRILAGLDGPPRDGD